MATRTIVCPECGSVGAHGRYTCSACGALLAAVAMTPRSRASTFPADAVGESTTDGPMAGIGDDPTSGAPAASEAAAPTAALVEDPADAANAASDAPVAAPVGVALAFDEDAPLASLASATTGMPAVAISLTATPAVAATRTPVRPASEPDVLHDLVDPAAVDDWSDDPPLASSWKPTMDRGAGAVPEPRTPAGAYLPPSAVLPSPDVRVPRRDATPPPALAGAGLAGTGTVAGTWAGRGSAALTDVLGSVRATADAARRAVATGAGLAMLGLLLPWVNTPPGQNPFAGYLDRWGLAGPGLWLVFIGLVALTAVAASSGRTASWPVGLPAVATATFLAGLIWPYLVGGSGRSIGIWVMLVAVAVLVVGGLLDLRRRHDDPHPTV